MKLLTKTFFTLMVTTVSLIPAQSMAEMSDAMHTNEGVFASAMSDTELGTMRGGFTNSSLQFSSLSATLSGNTATNNVSGANNIGTGAFNNIAGLTSVIQNSGNNVVIQYSTLVNVKFLP